MSDTTIGRVLHAILDNQVERTRAAFENLPADLVAVDPGGGCNSIGDIGRHLLVLRRFQLSLLESPRASSIADPDSVDSLEGLAAALDEAAGELRAAIAEHDPDDWLAVPDPPREGKWGELPMIERLTRPLNDFTNHLGSVRVIRRMHGSPAERTQ